MVSGGGENANGAISSEVQAQTGTKPVDPVAGKTVAEILGEIVWLMTQDPAGRELKVAEIEQLVMPAILQKRLHIKYSQVPDMRRPGASALQPVSVQIFALLDYAANPQQPPTELVSFSLVGRKQQP